MFAFNEGVDLLVANTPNLKVEGTNFYGNAIAGAPALEKNSPFVQAKNIANFTVSDGTNFQFSVGDGTRGIVADGCLDMTLTNGVRFDSLKNSDKENAGGAAMSLIGSSAKIENVSFNNLKSTKGPAIFSKDSKIDIGDVKFAKTQQDFKFGYTKDY